MNSIAKSDLWDSREAEKLTFAEAAHLYRRVAFGGTREEILAATQRPLGTVVEALFPASNASEPSPQLEQNFSQMKMVVAAGNSATQLPAWWLYRMIHTKFPAQEKLVLFWHGHFATSAAKILSPALMLKQNESLRRHASGKFEELVLAISRDPAMLLYLDSASNKRNRPNENYARELLELFCLGLGNYTERDIKELARAFTGWELRGESFQFNRFQHDPGEKTILGQSGIESGEQAIAVVAHHPKTAEFLAQKLFRYYVADEDSDLAAAAMPLSQCLRENDFDVGRGLYKLFTSRLFYSDRALGRKIRSPVELAVGLLRGLATTANTITLAGSTRELGQALFFPPNVKGWDGGRDWINSATLIGRINLVVRLLDEASTFESRAVDSLDSEHGINSAIQAVERAESLFLAVPLSDEQKETIAKLVEDSRSERSKLIAAIKALASLGEFQLA